MAQFGPSRSGELIAQIRSSASSEEQVEFLKGSYSRIELFHNRAVAVSCRFIPCGPAPGRDALLHALQRAARTGGIGSFWVLRPQKKRGPTVPTANLHVRRAAVGPVEWRAPLTQVVAA